MSSTLKRVRHHLDKHRFDFCCHWPEHVAKQCLIADIVPQPMGRRVLCDRKGKSAIQGVNHGVPSCRTVQSVTYARHKILLIDAHTVDDQIPAILKVVVQYAQRHFAFRGDVAQTGIGVAQFLQAMIALSTIWRFFISCLADLRSARAWIVSVISVMVQLYKQAGPDAHDIRPKHAYPSRAFRKIRGSLNQLGLCWNCVRRRPTLFCFLLVMNHGGRGNSVN